MSSSTIRLKQSFLEIFVGIAIPLLISFVLLSPIILPHGIPFYGDEIYYYINFESFYFNPLNWLFQWTPARGLAPPLLTFFSYSIPLASLVAVFGQELAVKAFILVVASLPGILAYFALKILTEEWSLFSDEKKARLFALTGSLFVLLSFTNSGLGGAGTAPAWALIMLPISFALLVRYLRNSSIKHLLLLGLCSLFAIANPFWMYLMIIMGLIYLIIEAAFSRQPKLILLKRSMTVILVLLAINAFWLVPTAAGYLRGGGGVFQVYTTERFISFGGLLFLSHWKLLDVLMVGEHQYYFFWLHPQNYGPLSVMIPILAGASLLAFRRNRHVIFMEFVFVVGVFLTKGAHEPAGYLYYIIAKSLPYGAGAILRNPTKFVPLISFSYAFLIGLTIAKLYEKTKTLKTPKVWRSKAASYGLALGLMLLFLAPVTYGTLLDLQGYTWPRYKPTYIPEVYDELNSWLSNQPGGFKVMWIPSGGAYVWKPYVITAFPDLYSSRPAVSFRQVYPQPLESTDKVGELLKVLGVKYVIYHGDSLNYPNEEILQDLLRQKDLKIVYESNYTYVSENNSGSPLPMNQPDFQFSQSPFKLITPEALPRGNEAEVIIQYTIPQSVVEKGFKGKFWARFSIRLNGFSAGSVSLDKRVFWAGVYEQRMINDTFGYAIFKVKIPYTYPGTAIDVYANFYDGCFRPLTSSYFVARLPVSPREVTLPFIVFENEEYNGSVYLSNLALTYGLSLADTLNIEGFDTAAWSVIPIGDYSTSRNLLNLSRAFIYSNSTLPSWLDDLLATSNITLYYVIPLYSFNLRIEKSIIGPYEPSYCVYSEKPLILLGEPFLNRGRSTLLNFSYYLPKPVLDEGYKGKFCVGFGIKLWGYPHGVAPPPDIELRYRVFEAFISNFTLVDDYRGYVAFNITVPESFEGTEVDVYANFYDGGFRQISPTYFVGTFKVKGAALVRDNFKSLKLHIIRDNLPINLCIPRSGNYALAVKATGTLNVNGIQLNCNGDWKYLPLPELKRGNHVIVLSTDNEAFIQGLILFTLNQEVNGLREIFKVETASSLLNYKQISPVEWEVTVNASSPFVLVFTEPYDRLWRAYVNSKEVEPIMLYGMVNGFPIIETGILHIRIYYTLQTYYNIGLFTSCISFVILAFLYIYRKP
jgi:hypothetical protein